MPVRESDGIQDLVVTGTKSLPPRPDILDALEKDYPIEASIADLVDNSIDAKAENVLVRFVLRGNTLVSLCIADDGVGMDEEAIDAAMTFAARRTYGRTDLGMFGVGLKSASLSQADSVTVVSRSRGAAPVGRQWTKSGIKKHDWSVNIIAEHSAKTLLDHPWGTVGPVARGTVVRWDRVYDFERLREGVSGYIEQVKLRIQHHLGLKLHRFLERRQLSICIDVEDAASGETSPPTEIAPLNPFPGEGNSGARGYPKQFTVQLPGTGTLTLNAHIWRKKSREDGYRLGGGRVAEHQGFYFYRHDRLIQDGGWCRIIGTSEPHLSLARVDADIPDALSSYLKVKSNKAGVDVPSTFSDAMLHCTARDGTTFREYLQKAEEVYRTRGEQRARPILRPGDGIPAEVKDALEAEGVPFVKGRAVSISWGRVDDDDFFDIDLDARRVVLNEKHRRVLLRGERGGKTDVPLLRTLLYFGLESLLAGDRIGSVERKRLESIRLAMTAAMRAERRWAGK